MATYSNILAWRILWTEEPDRLQSMGLQGVGHNWRHLACKHMLSQILVFKNALSVQSLSHVQLFVSPWTRAHQAPLSVEFSRQEYWSGLPFPSPGNLPDPGIKPTSLAPPALQVDSLPSDPPGKSQTSYAFSKSATLLWASVSLSVKILG